MTENNQQKCSLIALIGAPNVGKSTLVNFLVGQKISIVSPKVQTTRNNIKAILVEGDTQLVLLDTPGLFIPSKTRLLERMIVKSAWQAIKEADLICLIIDAVKGFDNQLENILGDLKKHQIQPIIVINKIDLVKKEKLLPITAKLIEMGLEKIFMICAVSGDGIIDLKNHLILLAKLAPWAFDGDQISDAPMSFLAAEITREKLFLKLYEDLPYSLAVKTENWQTLADGSAKIHQIIYVEKESQKAIVVGKNGAMIKQIGSEARADIETMTGHKAHLYLLVKVKENWINDL